MKNPIPPSVATVTTKRIGIVNGEKVEERIKAIQMPNDRNRQERLSLAQGYLDPFYRRPGATGITN